jgi:dephospho-CoA kinase
MRPSRPPTTSLRPNPPATSTNAGRPLAVAITGPIGAGKSAALEAFARHGAATRSSDEVVHRLLRDDPDVQRKLVERFGAAVSGGAGADREALGRIVFNDPQALEWLEGLLHPLVVQEHAAWLEELAATPDSPSVAVTEVPLLFETGGEQRFDVVVVITAPPDVRARRRPLADRREQRFLPEEEKIRRADYSYLNDGTLEDLDAFVGDVMIRLVSC